MFVTHVDELDMTLEEMYVVSGLSWRELLYEEYIPPIEVLTRLKKRSPYMQAVY